MQSHLETAAGPSVAKRHPLVAPSRASIMSVHLSASQEQHDPNMAVGDFKQHLYSQLKAAGVMSSLKVCNHKQIACKCGGETADFQCTSMCQLQTQLRSQVLSKLQKQQCSIHAAVPSSDALWRGLMNSLVVDYLTACHYHYTLSVFQPEAGLSGLQTLNHKDILQLMHIESGSPLQAALSKRGASTEGMTLYLVLHTARFLCMLLHEVHPDTHTLLTHSKGQIVCKS